MNTSSLPPADLLQQQAEWLAPARARLLRGGGIAHRRRILDLGAGYGAVTGELVRRGGGMVAALDRELDALRQITTGHRAGGDARCLPFATASFDLVFCQCVLLWVEDITAVVAEIHRTLQPGGVLVALEPDYGGLIEYPPEIATRDLWLAALRRAGAEPLIGRMLPGLLTQQGFQVQTRLLDEVTAPLPLRFKFLQTLPLTAVEIATLHEIDRSTSQKVAKTYLAHLPFFLVTASKLPVS